MGEFRGLPREYQLVFAEAEGTPAINQLWQQMRHTYWNVSLPVDLRELILAQLAHCGRSRICRAIHGGYLLAGRAPTADGLQCFDPVESKHLLSTLRDPSLHFDQQADSVAVLSSTDVQIGPSSGGQQLPESVQAALLNAVTLAAFARTNPAPLTAALRHFLGDQRFNELQLLISWFRVSEQWALAGCDDPASLEQSGPASPWDQRFRDWVNDGCTCDQIGTKSNSRPPATIGRTGSGQTHGRSSGPADPVDDPLAIQAALVESEARYRRFVDQTLDGTYRLDFDPPIVTDQPEQTVIQQMYERGRIGDCNAAYARMYGFKQPQDMVGVTLTELHGGNNVPENLQAMKEFVQAGFQHLHVRTVELDRDGNTVHLINNSMGVVADGLYHCCWGTQTDITELVEAQENVRRHHELSEIAINTSPNIVALLDPDGRIRRVNPCLIELSGWTESDVVGRDWFTTFFHQDDQAQVRALFCASPSAESVPGFFTRLKTRSGEFRDIEWRCATMTDEAGRAFGLLCTGQDVTERKIMERHVLQASTDEQRRIAQDLHDGVGQQLTGLSMMADVLKRLTNPATGRADYETLAEISSELAAGLNDALSQVRNLARGLYPVVIDPDGLSSALEELCRNTSRLYKLPIRLTHSVSSEFADRQIPTQLYRIAQEAITNAVRHAQPSAVDIRLSRHEDQLCLAVSNDGTSLPSAADRQGGLGLRSMNYRARMIGATLDIHPVATGGTQVVCKVGLSSCRESDS